MNSDLCRCCVRPLEGTVVSLPTLSVCPTVLWMRRGWREREREREREGGREGFAKRSNTHTHSHTHSLSVSRYLQSSSPAAKATALSDTEVEVKDRLSSKLWEWSGDSSRHLSNTEVLCCMCTMYVQYLPRKLSGHSLRTPL